MDKQSGHKAACELPSLDSEHGQKDEFGSKKLRITKPANISLPARPLPGFFAATSCARTLSCLQKNHLPYTLRLHENHQEKSGQTRFACS